MEPYKTVYYPKVEVRTFNNTIEISTNLRKKHTDGKWYLSRFLKHFSYTNPKDIIAFVNRFHSEVYLFDKLGVVIAETSFSDMKMLMPEDPLQIEETERLRAI